MASIDERVIITEKYGILFQEKNDWNTETFYSKYPIIGDLFDKFPNKFVLAGGAISGILFNTPFTDFDFFLIGFDDIASQNKFIDEIIQYLRKDTDLYIPDKYITKTENACSIYTHEYGKCIFQFVPTMFKNGKELIDKFDINACMCYFNGENIFFNDHFENFMRNGCFYVVNNDKNTEDRIFKYMNKGYAFLLKNYNIKTEFEIVKEEKNILTIKSKHDYEKSLNRNYLFAHFKSLNTHEPQYKFVSEGLFIPRLTRILNTTLIKGICEK